MTKHICECCGWVVIKPSWIPVQERLPERHMDVLVLRHEDIFDVAFVDIDGDWEAHGPINGVTHWMPLPPLPDHSPDAGKEVQG